MLQYNRLYQSLKKVSAEWHAGHVQWEYYWNYIMFFEDGIVIEGSVRSDDTEKIKLAFSRNNANLTTGNFSKNEKEITINFDKYTFHGAFTFEEKLVLQSNVTQAWDIYTPIG